MAQTLQSLQSARLLCFDRRRTRMTGARWRWSVTIGITAIMLASATWAAENAWLTGSAFRQKLQEPVGITWSEMPLRAGLRKLSQSQGLAIYLDRRADPDQLVTFSCENKPLVRALHDMARPLQLGIGYVGPVIYVGPPLTSARVATLAERRNEQVDALPLASRNRLIERSPLRWDEFAEPRLLIARTASEVGMTVPNIRALPHDLWWADELPPMTFSEKMTLLTAGFEMSFKVDGPRVYLTRFPHAVGLVRDYRTGDPERLAAVLQKEFPQAFVSVDNERQSVKVRSLLEDHWRIDRIRSGKSDNPKAPEKVDRSRQRFTMTIDNKPIGPLLELLGKKLDLPVVYDDSVTDESRQTMVSASVTDATAESLLEAVAKPAGLNADIQPDGIKVTSL